MNQIFEFRKELNIKKIIILVLIIIIIITLICVIFAGNPKKIEQTKIEELESTNPNSSFYDSNKEISLTFPKTYGFSQYNSANGYILELRSDNNLNIFVSKNDLISSKPLKDIVSSDINVYINEFQNHSNISEITEFDYNDRKGYTYSLHYLNSKTPYYLQVVWLETNKAYYTFDIEFPLDDLNSYTNIINQVIDNFKVY